jgi:CheY-like chemotaxis protein
MEPYGADLLTPSFVICISKQHHLHHQGHLCEMAEDGLIAIEQVQRRLFIGNGDKTTYDAILMDFVMPNMDGPTATKQIRELGYNGLIFGVTGNALQSDLEFFKVRVIRTYGVKLASFF